MENTLGNKAKFFALYLHQEVVVRPEWKKHSQHIDCNPLPIDPAYLKTGNEILPTAHLQLTPLSQITDEDAYYVGASVNCWSWAERKMEFFRDDELSETHISFGKIFTEAIGKEFGPGLSHPFAHNSTDILHAYDYLRSRGYALPYMGVSVETLVEWAWVKLKDTNNE